ncbi:MAG: hypothetical protein L6V79_06925 [Clostridium sp.]|nr:MAG: hypothetical protein L6V79_06925 [Clostridium sp.]
MYEKELTEQYDSQKNKLKAKRGKTDSRCHKCKYSTIWFPHTANYADSAVSYYVTKDYIAAENRQLEQDIKEFDEGETNE